MKVWQVRVLRYILVWNKGRLQKKVKIRKRKTAVLECAMGSKKAKVSRGLVTWSSDSVLSAQYCTPLPRPPSGLRDQQVTEIVANVFRIRFTNMGIVDLMRTRVFMQVKMRTSD